MFKRRWIAYRGASKHPADEDLLAYVDGELDGSSRERVRKHLNACWPCRSRKQKIDVAIARFVESDERLLAGKEPPGAWRAFEARLDQADAALERAAMDRAPVRLQFPFKAAAAFGVTVVAIVAGTIWLRPQNPEKKPAQAPQAVYRSTPGEMRPPIIPAPPEEPSPAVTVDVRPPPPAPELVTQTAVDLDYALHQIGACLGGETRVVISGDRVRVVLSPTTSERTARLRSAIASVDPPAWVAVESGAGSVRRERVFVPQTNEAAASTSVGSPPMESVLRDYMKLHSERQGETPEQAAANVANRVVSQASAAVRDAWALRRLAEEYGERAVPPAAIAKLREMARDHARAIREDAEEVGRTVSAVIAQPLPSVTIATSSWPNSVTDIFQATEELEALISASFAGEAAGVNSGSARLTDNPQQNARDILNAAARVVRLAGAIDLP